MCRVLGAKGRPRDQAHERIPLIHGILKIQLFCMLHGYSTIGAKKMGDLNLTTLKCLQAQGISKTFKLGQILQFQDDMVEDIFVLEDGLAVARFYEQRGKESWIDSYNVGDLIGVEHIQSGGPSRCQITARTDVSVLQFKRQSFSKLMRHHPEINLFVLDQMTARLKQFQDRRVESHMLSKRGRVASEIRRMAEPIDHRSAYIVTPRPVISDMALRLGIARETVSRTVSELVKSEVIERSSNAFFVPNMSLLEAQMR